ncbi:unnamed protein product [Prunus armeniaca]|uniref:Uncharacterized protein n=1 Tax=Prunus armeniaca TaxID=36596 RepID=A0A6J5W5P0_PRUAR|nr:unnamed protein product [Prunus armeniaca]
MGRKLDALLGRTFKTSKLKPLLNLALSRLAVLKNLRQVKFSQARSDVLQLLQLGHHERALLRVEQVIKEQNMLDVLVMIERYCNLVIERVHLIEQERVCPDELREATSSLLYAASRCGDFPELQEIRTVLTSRFGKEFTARAIEVRNNCGVNLTMMQKLSTRMPVLEIRVKVLKEIAAENSIVLQLEETTSVSTEEKLDVNKNQNQAAPNPPASSSGTASADNLQALSQETEKDDRFSGSLKNRKYKDVADAAQAAFESAAYAAAAARAAVELSRSESHDPDDQNSPGSKRGRLSDRYESFKSESESQNEQNRGEELKRSTSSSSLDSDGDAMVHASLSGKDIAFDESESDNERSAMPPSHKQIPSRFQSGLKVESAHAAGGSGRQSPPRLNIEKAPFSLRTRGVRGY